MRILDLVNDAGLIVAPGPGLKLSMVSVECCLYVEYQDVDLDNERDVGMSEDGNHCIHSGSCHCVSVGLEADNVVDLDTEWDVGMSEDGNHCIHDDLDTVEAISRRFWNSVTCEFCHCDNVNYL